MDPIFFTPIYQERVWGGRRLQSSLGRSLPSSKPIGESWEIVDRPEANSIVSSGEFAGLSLRQILGAHSDQVMGPNYPANKPFPILVKWLDCQERLSLQVHPPASIAPSLGGEPKTENWFVVETWGDSAVLAGIQSGVSRQSFEAALRQQALEPLVPRLPTQPGDSLFVPSGRLHAIDGGNLILEIQQNSDTTYRVYDWGRVGLDGQPRQLHIEESLASIDFADEAPHLIHAANQSTTLVDAAEFSLLCRHIQSGASISFPAFEQPRILSVTKALCYIKTPCYPKAPNVLLPFCASHTFSATEQTTLLITERFAQ
ncbi:MAG: class I mannose-6-phosphate isomerase [Verrucomicrobia bacterium]|nr:class I mannose-6-phosphate isomerase [Verrucomicrobiota bacterium]